MVSRSSRRRRSGLLGRTSVLLALVVLAAVSLWQVLGTDTEVQDRAADVPAGAGSAPLAAGQGDLPTAPAAHTPGVSAEEQGDREAALAAFAVGVRAEEQGGLAAALAAFARAADLDPSNVDYLNEAGRLAELLGLHEEAAKFYERGLDVQREALGDADPKVADQLNRLAALYRSQGRFEEALRLFDEALAVNEGFYGSDHPTVVAGLAHKAMVYRDLGMPEEAEFYYKQSISAAERIDGYESAEVIENVALLADFYESQGRSEEAEPLYERMLAIIEGGQSIEGVDDLDLRHVLGKAELRQGNLEQAEKLFAENLAQSEARYGKDDPRLQPQLSDLASVYKSQEKWAETEEIYQRMLSNELATGGFEKPSVAAMLIAIAQMNEKLGTAYHDLGMEEKAREQGQKALAYYESALSASEQAFGPDHETTIALQGILDGMRQLP